MLQDSQHRHYLVGKCTANMEFLSAPSNVHPEPCNNPFMHVDAKEAVLAIHSSKLVHKTYPKDTISEVNVDSFLQVPILSISQLQL